ncbi:MAG: SRPBCC domain-containing protein [Chitinophagales bacterium]
MQEINSKIIINAPKKVVWDILLDFEKYEEWNPFTRKVVCELKLENEVVLYVDMNGNGKTMLSKQKLLWIKENESIAWGTGFPIRNERAQILTAINENKTEYLTYDKFYGVLVPQVILFFGKKIQKGFDEIALALKERAESM